MQDEARPQAGPGGASRHGPAAQAPGRGRGTDPCPIGLAGEIVVTRPVAGVAITRREPRRDFIGVMLTVPRADSRQGYGLFLAAAAGGADVALADGLGEDDVVARWRETAAALGLPALARHANGEVEVLQQQFGGVAIGSSAARRRRAMAPTRRPRFLKRRKVGRAAAK